MPRQTHEHQTGTGKYPALADVNELTWLAANPTDFEETIYGDRVVILARNTSPDDDLDVTLTSVASSLTGRTGTITKEVPFGEIIILGPLGADGWRQSDGTIYFAAEDPGDDGEDPPVALPGIEFAVVRL